MDGAVVCLVVKYTLIFGFVGTLAVMAVDEALFNLRSHSGWRLWRIPRGPVAFFGVVALFFIAPLIVHFPQESHVVISRDGQIMRTPNYIGSDWSAVSLSSPYQKEYCVTTQYGVCHVEVRFALRPATSPDGLVSLLWSDSHISFVGVADGNVALDRQLVRTIMQAANFDHSTNEVEIRTHLDHAFTPHRRAGLEVEVASVSWRSKS